ncbi:uncharacterized protein NPIL_297081 [Nephila pilipes]|uniref:Uncharacterized protein n=1 Tax=Nephila pilipes TaxID=299642 RepID=A0A8X6QIT5_NEPPI|nr:uncharacterized protein NPIL_297081 [Nephila pilipes]
MSSDAERNDSSKDPISSLDSVSKRIEDLEMRVGEVLNKQEQMQDALEALKAEFFLEGEEEQSSKEEKSSDVEFPEDSQFTEDLKRILEDMLNAQRTWMENVKDMSKVSQGVKALNVFKDIEKDLCERLRYLESAKSLIEGPLFEEPPPPPPPPPPPEEPPEPEKKKKPGKKDKKSKKTPKK